MTPYDAITYLLTRVYWTKQYQPDSSRGRISRHAKSPDPEQRDVSCDPHPEHIRARARRSARFFERGGRCGRRAECRGFHIGSPRFVFVETKRPSPRCVRVYAGGLE